MDKTKERTQSGEARAKPGPDEAARAKAYLDLWERNLVHAAVHGRVPAGDRKPA